MLINDFLFIYSFLENNKNIFLPLKIVFLKKQSEGEFVISHFVTHMLIEGILVYFFKLKKFFFFFEKITSASSLLINSG